MTQVTCGSVIYRKDRSNDPGTAGCLVQFPDLPEKLLLLTAGHVLVSLTAKQFDPIGALELGDRSLGVLQGWTRVEEVGGVTTDAALVHVDPALVTPEIGSLGVPKGVNRAPEDNMSLTIYAMGRIRTGQIRQRAASMSLVLVGPDFQKQVTYYGQLLCSSFSENGCSGAMALDGDGKVVGMVVAGDGSTFTLITPIGAILRHPDWGADPNLPALEVVSAIPATARSPAIPAPPPAAPSVGTGTFGNVQVAWGRSVTAAFKQKLLVVCGRLGVDPSFMMACIAFETGRTFRADKWNSQHVAVGLIQFTRVNEGMLRVTLEQLAAMTEVEQLDYVEIYFRHWMDRLNVRLATLSDVYMAIFCPRAVGQEESFCLYQAPSREYDLNARLDTHEDGKITKAEAAEFPSRLLIEGLSQANLG